MAKPIPRPAPVTSTVGHAVPFRCFACTDARRRSPAGSPRSTPRGGARPVPAVSSTGRRATGRPLPRWRRRPSSTATAPPLRRRRRESTVRRATGPVSREHLGCHGGGFGGFVATARRRQDGTTAREVGAQQNLAPHADECRDRIRLLDEPTISRRPSRPPRNVSRAATNSALPPGKLRYIERRVTRLVSRIWAMPVPATPWRCIRAAVALASRSARRNVCNIPIGLLRSSRTGRPKVYSRHSAPSTGEHPTVQHPEPAPAAALRPGTAEPHHEGRAERGLGDRDERSRRTPRTGSTPRGARAATAW